MINPLGAAVDAVDHLEWEDSKDELRQLKTPVIITHEGLRRRGNRACEIQHMFGAYCVWQSGKPNALDVMTLHKVKRVGGTLAFVSGQRVSTNSHPSTR